MNQTRLRSHSYLAFPNSIRFIAAHLTSSLSLDCEIISISIHFSRSFSVSSSESLPNTLQHEHTLHAGITISARLAALACFLIIEPRPYSILIEPKRDTPPISQSFVILITSYGRGIAICFFSQTEHNSFTAHSLFT